MTAALKQPEVRERPILFNGEMVRAVLSGEKTQTRRIVKARENVCAACLRDAVPHNAESLTAPDGGPNVAAAVFGSDPYLRVGYCDHNEATGERIRCPHGSVGDRLWVRESWKPHALDGTRALYMADGDVPDGYRWRPSIHMPRWASRLTLEITGIRAERLHDITEADAIAEGVEGPGPGVVLSTGKLGFSFFGVGTFPTAREAFEFGWCVINGGDSWRANPWVWVVEFRRLP